ncbi:MAG: GDP-mannose-dependent alpha-(1-6)-phosphatidylinositol monomannoside mannosyltransferase [Chlamydiae bacterium]|nr:GDP-mannose-dependent alpha-(1-6)-phosphatidylinositol monomannoside mannosyltransferase [Chlamydiota bacterium]
MKTAFVHDWLVGVAGGEKVLDAICELYNGPIYTLIKHELALEKTSFSDRILYTSYLQRFPKVHRYYRNLLPLFPSAIEQFDLSSYDLILSTSHAVAKSVKTHKNQLHICYCHTPMRYAWDLKEFHLNQLNPIKKRIAKPILRYLRDWDQRTHDRTHHFIANSKCVARRIEKNYGRSAQVIYPPVETHLFSPSSVKENYFITCSRLVPYKRVDVLVAAFSMMPDEKLVIIGDGPEMNRLKSRATKNVEFLGHQPDPVLRDMLSKARAFLFAAEEDFGIVGVEAQASGLPVIAYAKGGSLETVLPGQTGIFFNEQTPSSVIDAIHRFEKMEGDFEPEKIQKHASQFSRERFQREFMNFIDEKLQAFS